MLQMTLFLIVSESQLLTMCEYLPKPFPVRSISPGQHNYQHNHRLCRSNVGAKLKMLQSVVTTSSCAYAGYSLQLQDGSVGSLKTAFYLSVRLSCSFTLEILQYNKAVLSKETVRRFQQPHYSLSLYACSPWNPCEYPHKPQISRNYKSHWFTSSSLIVYGSVFIQICVVGSERRICFETECVMALQGRRRSLILAPNAISYWSSIVTLVLSCPVSEMLQVVCSEPRPHPYSTRILKVFPLDQTADVSEIERERDGHIQL